MACTSLSPLSAIEEQLIALAQPVVKIVHLRGGQLGYSGSCVAVTQDITRLESKLPRAVSECGTVVVIKEFMDSAGSDVIKKFRIRRQVVSDWLRWLKANNPFYASIEIVQEALDNLPVDSGSSLDHLKCIAVEDDSTDAEQTGFKEMVVSGKWEGVEQEALEATLDWPTSSKAAIREFKHPGV